MNEQLTEQLQQARDTLKELNKYNNSIIAAETEKNCLKKPTWWPSSKVIIIWCISIMLTYKSEAKRS